MNSDLQRLNLRITQLERNNRMLRAKIKKLKRKYEKM